MGAIWKPIKGFSTGLLLKILHEAEEKGRTLEHYQENMFGLCL